MLRREGIARESIDDQVVLDDLVRGVENRLKGVKLTFLLNECCVLEEKRLARATDAGELAYRQRLRDLRRRLSWATEDELKSDLRDLVRLYGEEIHGHFDASTYENATRVLPAGLALLLRKQKLWSGLSRGLRGQLSLSEKVRYSGAVKAFDGLVEQGTCILVPTHLSNLDSPAIGFALHEAGLPPMIYGAGINLFTNWLLSWFMDHLGAYRIDRAKQHQLYKEVLKEYATYALERRWHSLFFPGGTRSRSGGIERRLKKGLLATGLEAYQRGLASGREKNRVFFIPATINYNLVLEAETLIEDYLQDAGKSRYIISDDEFSRPDRVLQFVRNMLALDNPIEVVFGAPLDPFGNRVDRNGDSLDPGGRPFDPAGYVMTGGQLVVDPQRDRQYTSVLAEKITAAYARDTILYETHVLAAALHRLLEARHPGTDLFERLLLPLDARRFDQREVDGELRVMLAELRSLSARGEVLLRGQLPQGRPEDICRAAVTQFGRYHKVKAVSEDGTSLVLEDPRLALFYAKRLDPYALSAPTLGIGDSL
jgi:glycerol-3-phosphate O-acyltransferase